MKDVAGIATMIRMTLIGAVHGLRRKKRVGIALSGGLDSNTVLAACLDSGVKPTVFSYEPNTNSSTDFKYAGTTARRLGLRFVPVLVGMHAENLGGVARNLALRGYKTKLQVECLTPMWFVLREAAAAGMDYLLTGDQADGFYINNNWMARNYDRAQGIPGPQRQPVRFDTTADRIDKLRDIYWQEDRSCSGALQSLGAELDLDVVVPYRNQVLREAFQGSHWCDINEPRLKEPSWRAWDEYLNVRFDVRPKPVNLHRGDSRFAETMGRTLMAAHPGPWRTPTGLYAAMARGEV